MTPRENEDFRDKLDERHEFLSRRLDQIQSTGDTTVGLLRQLNGRISVAETDIAILKERNPSAKPGGILGSIGGFLGGLLSGILTRP